MWNLFSERKDESLRRNRSATGSRERSPFAKNYRAPIWNNGVTLGVRWESHQRGARDFSSVTAGLLILNFASVQRFTLDFAGLHNLADYGCRAQGGTGAQSGSF